MLEDTVKNPIKHLYKSSGSWAFEDVVLGSQTSSSWATGKFSTDFEELLEASAPAECKVTRNWSVASQCAQQAARQKNREYKGFA